MKPMQPSDTPSRRDPAVTAPPFRAPPFSDRAVEDRAAEHPCSDLDWLAHRHLLGELDEVEMAAFAERLGTDDEALAALERASGLLAAIAATHALPGGAETTIHGVPLKRVPLKRVPLKRVAQKRAGWLGIGAAGIAAAVALAVMLSGPAATPRGRTAELLSLWQINAAGVREDAGWDAVWDDGETSEESSDAPPAWLLAAVSLEAGPSGRPDAAPADVIERN
jgi:hypothetical protein